MSNTPIYFIRDYPSEDIFHGGIGNVDIEKVLLSLGAIPIEFPHRSRFSIFAKLARIQFLVKIYFTFPSNAMLVFQHPLFSGMSNALVSLLIRSKKGNVVCLIADIDGIKDGNSLTLEKEKEWFRQFRYFIVHNENMNNWLRSFLPGCKTAILNCFDFLAPFENYTRINSREVVFAGNLEKSGFLKKLPELFNKHPEIIFRLYGPGVSESMLSGNISFEGVFHPYELPRHLKGSYGLIWDGEGSEPAGSLGNYMQYISHHKLSLYIACQMPIIVHVATGSASFILKHGIGVVIRSLEELPGTIKKISDDHYQLMVENMRPLARMLSKGEFLKNAIWEINESVEKGRRSGFELVD